ncbi:MAG: hypothetical protein CL862_04975 [Cyanobium sp. NAT70]|nr:hypothetical protein [Cyanobium sp. NAT70]|tara:strand:+ start:106 stop:291 length:186 start_codon:yes stop_codon:yes gene_type:complete
MSCLLSQTARLLASASLLDCEIQMSRHQAGRSSSATDLYAEILASHDLIDEMWWFALCAAS